MMEVKTDSGNTYAVEEGVLNDFELLEELTELDGGNALVLPSVITRILGREGKAVLFDNLRNEAGRVPTDAVTAELLEIIKGISGGKK